MNDLKVFAYGEQKVRTVLVENEPWWVLADVCRVLGLKEPHRVAARLDGDEKMTRPLATGHLGKRGGAQSNILVSESGLYSVILRSDKPEAKEFKRWVTHEVLPSIRQTGAYATPAWSPPNVVPVAVPVAPDLPIETALRRAELLIRAAEHPALPQEEQLRLLNQASVDLTGMGVRAPVVEAPEGARFPAAFLSSNREEVERDA